MANIENFLKNIYDGNSSTMIYVYLGLAAVAVLVILIIIVVSVAASKKKPKEVTIKPEEKPVTQDIKIEEVIIPEKPLVIEEAKPQIEPIKEEPLKIEEETKPEPIIEKTKEEPIKEPIFSSVYLDRKEETKPEINPSVTEKIESAEIKPDIIELIENPITPEESVIPEVKEELFQKPEIDLDFNIFESESKEDSLKDIPEPDFNNTPDIFNMSPIVPETKPEKPNQSTRPVILSSDDLKARLADLQSKTKEDVNELENLLKQVGINDEEREIPNLANEEKAILGR